MKKAAHAHDDGSCNCAVSQFNDHWTKCKLCQLGELCIVGHVLLDKVEPPRPN